MVIQQSIEQKLREAFSPSSLEVINESALHKGHSHDGGQPFDGNGETHFRVRIAASQFIQMSRIERHRAITDVLKDELAGPVHALAIEASTP